MSRQRSALRNHLEFGLYRGVRGLVSVLGPQSIARIGGLLGRSYLRIGKRRREIIDFNLKLAFPDLDQTQRDDLARRVAAHFGRVLLDALRIQRLDPQAFRREITVEGGFNLERALGHDRGIILLSAHIGSWEVAALETGLALDRGFAVINRPLDNPFLETELDRLRSLFGNQALGRDNIARSVLRHLGQGGGVGILIDQRARPREGIEVSFFGHPASTHPILARFARKTRAPVVPLWAFWEGPGRYRVLYEEPILVDDLESDQLDDHTLTQLFTQVTERIIRQRPDQWLWYHDRWRALRLGIS